MIESTFMKHGKDPGALIGITQQRRLVKKWAYSLHVSTQLLHDLNEMRHKKQREVTTAKEKKIPAVSKLIE